MKQWMVFCLVGLYFQSVLSGGTSAGGGKGIVCRDENKKVVSAQMLDLWEAENIFGRKINYSNLSVEEQAFSYGQNFFKVIEGSGNIDDRNQHIRGPEAGGYQMLWMQRFFMNPEKYCKSRYVKDNAHCATEWSKRVKMLRNVSLSDSEDSLEMAVPNIPGCRLEQIVLYRDGQSMPFNFPADDEVFINADIFEKLNNTNKAALILHEAIYKYLRVEDKDTDSRRARRSVGALMEGEVISSYTDFLAPGPRFSCHNYESNDQDGVGPAPMTWVYLLRKPHQGKDTIQLIPRTLNGKQLLGPNSIDSWVFLSNPPYDIPAGDSWMNPGYHFTGYTDIESNIDLNGHHLKYEYSFENGAKSPTLRIQLSDVIGRENTIIDLNCTLY